MFVFVLDCWKIGCGQAKKSSWSHFLLLKKFALFLDVICSESLCSKNTFRHVEKEWGNNAFSCIVRFGVNPSLTNTEDNPPGVYFKNEKNEGNSWLSVSEREVPQTSDIYYCAYVLAVSTMHLYLIFSCFQVGLPQMKTNPTAFHWNISVTTLNIKYNTDKWGRLHSNIISSPLLLSLCPVWHSAGPAQWNKP